MNSVLFLKSKQLSTTKEIVKRKLASWKCFTSKLIFSFIVKLVENSTNSKESTTKISVNAFLTN